MRIVLIDFLEDLRNSRAQVTHRGGARLTCLPNTNQIGGMFDIIIVSYQVPALYSYYTICSIWGILVIRAVVILTLCLKIKPFGI